MPIVYSDPNEDVPPGVDFLDAEQVSAWVLACEIEKPWRIPMRNKFSELVRKLPEGANVLELGSGPGYLAEAILGSCPFLRSYTLFDFSEFMIERSRAHLARFEKARFVRGDFKKSGWERALAGPFSAVLAMQAVHEIRHKRHVPGLYAEMRTILEPGGLLAVCDGIPRDPTNLVQCSLYLSAEEQLAALASAGFVDVRLVAQESPIAFVSGRAPG